MGVVPQIIYSTGIFHSKPSSYWGTHGYPICGELLALGHPHVLPSLPEIPWCLVPVVRYPQRRQRRVGTVQGQKIDWKSNNLIPRSSWLTLIDYWLLSRAKPKNAQKKTQLSHTAKQMGISIKRREPTRAASTNKAKGITTRSFFSMSCLRAAVDCTVGGNVNSGWPWWWCYPTPCHVFNLSSWMSKVLNCLLIKFSCRCGIPGIL